MRSKPSGCTALEFAEVARHLPIEANSQIHRRPLLGYGVDHEQWALPAASKHDAIARGARDESAMHLTRKPFDRIPSAALQLLLVGADHGRGVTGRVENRFQVHRSSSARAEKASQESRS